MSEESEKVEEEKQATSNSEKDGWSPSFDCYFQDLPEKIQKSVRKAIRMYEESPRAKGLMLHRLKDNKRGSHFDGSWSVRVNQQYRAIFVIVNGKALWYWVGTHNDYNRFSGDS